MRPAEVTRSVDVEDARVLAPFPACREAPCHRGPSLVLSYMLDPDVTSPPRPEGAEGELRSGGHGPVLAWPP